MPKRGPNDRPGPGELTFGEYIMNTKGKTPVEEEVRMLVRAEIAAGRLRADCTKREYFECLNRVVRERFEKPSTKH